MALEELNLIARGQKLIFPHWPAFHHLFCYHIYWCGDTQKGHLGCCSSLYDSPFLLQSGLYSGMCTGRGKTDASPSSPGLGNISKDYSAPLRAASEEDKKSNKGLGGKELNNFGLPSGLPLGHLHQFRW